MMKKVLLAGVTGYLGGYIAKALRERAYDIRAIARHPASAMEKDVQVSEIILAEMTAPDTIKGCCDGIDVVISTVGITRQKDGLTYMDVDYQANLNLLLEARKSGVKKFIYVSVFKGDSLRHLKICAAKESFVDQLKTSGLNYCIIRPNGFFSDMTEFYNMAKKGRIYLLGDGQKKVNPIHGEDLATLCVDAIEMPNNIKINAGGPEVLTHNEIALAAFEALGKKPRITHIPNWLKASVLWLTRTFSSSRTYGPIEFFMTVMGRDMIAPEYGDRTLSAYFNHLRRIQACEPSPQGITGRKAEGPD